MGKVNFKTKEKAEMERKENPRDKYAKLKEQGKAKTVAQTIERIELIEEILGL